jgi:YHS domain-containing protein
MIKYILMLIVCMLLFVGCTGEKQEQATTDDEVQVSSEQTVSANTECSGGCGMSMDKEKMIAYEHDGDTLYFCSEKCQEKYMAQEEAEGEDKMKDEG